VNSPTAQRIMVVDDVKINLLMIRRILQDYGGQVETYTNGPEAMDAAMRQAPDLILLDIGMPGMNGYQVCALLKENPQLRQIPVIFLTAHDTEEDKIRGFATGGVDYITKPFSPEEVRARVSVHLKLRALQARLELQNHDLEERVRQQVQQIADSQMATIFALAKLAEFRDPEAGGHIERVKSYCRLLATSLQSAEFDEIDADYINNVAMASVLHDIGKVAIPDSVLLKPERLNAEERRIMERHSLVGAETLEGVYRLHPENKFIRLGIEIARSHHEKWNGEGYPQGLAGKNIPLGARIMTVADVYDALRTQRRYKKAWTHEEASREIERLSGIEFDPLVVTAFLREEAAFRRIHDQFDRQESEK